MNIRNHVGLDLSLTCTGVVALNDDGELLLSRGISTKQRGIKRLIALSDEVETLVRDLRPTVVLLEGYAYSAVGRQHAAGELGGVVRYRLHQLNPHLPIASVPPSSLKKFASGKGNAPKDAMRIAVYKRWGFEAKTTDEVDAYAAAQMARSVCNPVHLTTSQQEALGKITWEVGAIEPECSG